MFELNWKNFMPIVYILVGCTYAPLNNWKLDGLFSFFNLNIVEELGAILITMGIIDIILQQFIFYTYNVLMQIQQKDGNVINQFELSYNDNKMSYDFIRYLCDFKNTLWFMSECFIVYSLFLTQKPLLLFATVVTMCALTKNLNESKVLFKVLCKDGDKIVDTFEVTSFSSIKSKPILKFKFIDNKKD
jgi:hypothetical protein